MYHQELKIIMVISWIFLNINNLIIDYFQFLEFILFQEMMNSLKMQLCFKSISLIILILLNIINF